MTTKVCQYFSFNSNNGITSYRGALEFDDGMDELLEALKTQ